MASVEVPWFYKYSDLRRRIENRKEDIECGISYKMVNVRALIDEVIQEKRDVRYLKGMAEPPGGKAKKNKVFISYSRKDIEWCKRIKTHLKAAAGIGIEIDAWDDNKIKPGEKWQDEIQKALQETKVALLLVSTAFLASDFIRNKEVPYFLQAAEKKGVVILPLVLEPCLYKEHASLSAFQTVNDPAAPLSALNKHEQDTILVKLVKRIISIISA